MTQDELDALPQTGGYEVRREVRDGKNVEYVAERAMIALYQPENEECYVVDSFGHRWMLGWHDGQRYKRALAI